VGSECHPHPEAVSSLAEAAVFSMEYDRGCHLVAGVMN
jgi:hypothetical protein